MVGQYSRGKDQEVVGSNPATPMTYEKGRFRYFNRPIHKEQCSKEISLHMLSMAPNRFRVDSIQYASLAQLVACLFDTGRGSPILPPCTDRPIQQFIFNG